MNCNCKWFESIIAIVIIVFAWWQIGASQWIITIAAALLLVHSMKCGNCGTCDPKDMPKKKKRK